MQGLATRRQRTRQAGISLVETLVALALGLTLVSVAFNLYVSNRSVFRQIEAMTRQQESASIAAALLETDLRHAAGVLCRKGAPLTNLLRGSTTYEAHLALANGVQGYESNTNRWHRRAHRALRATPSPFTAPTRARLPGSRRQQLQRRIRIPSRWTRRATFP